MYANKTITAVFHDQRDFEDQARNRNPPERDVTEEVLSLSLDDLHEMEDANDSDDVVLPPSRKEDGVSHVEVVESIEEFFDVPLALITAEMLADARAEHQIGVEKSYQVRVKETVTRETTVTVKAPSEMQARLIVSQEAAYASFWSEHKSTVTVETDQPVALPEASQAEKSRSRDERPRG